MAAIHAPTLSKSSLAHVRSDVEYTALTGLCDCLQGCDTFTLTPKAGKFSKRSC
jgi:hypothetical protein